MKNIFNIGLAVCVLVVSSCNKFLEKKPDIKMTIPKTLQDADLLLNDYAALNSGYPIWGEIGSDDYYLTKARWEGLSNVDQRNAYLWADLPYTDVTQWQRPYKTVYIANQAIEVSAKFNNNEKSLLYKRVIGGAHFFRAFALHSLVELHCSAYSNATAKTEFGIPIHRTAGVDEVSVRSSLEDSYMQIINDYKIASNNLPILEAVKGRPFKASAYAGLARVYLEMGNYNQAYLYADSCLQVNSNLLDFNSLKSTDSYPVSRFNIEVLFSALAESAAPLYPTTALMDTILIKSYDQHDLRKSIFFRVNDNVLDSYYYRGSYDQNATLFCGLTTSEVYLIKAEIASRAGDVAVALETINKLLRARWNNKVPYVNIVENDPERLLKIILQERRKELVFRGRRWSDLKRLNLDPRFKKTLNRAVGDKLYTLEPNSNKYAFRLSETVVELSGIPQNKR